MNEKLHDVDLDLFWKKDELAHKDNCFNAEAPQVALGIRMSGECVYAELGEEGDMWGVEPRDRRIELNKRYNDKAERIVGIRLLNEDFPPEDAVFPAIKQIGEIFGGTYTYHKDGGLWLSSPIETIPELETMLDSVDKLDIRSFILPDNWKQEKKRIFETYGTKPGLLRGVRGPVTLGTSIYGVENLIFLYYDAPELFKRFSDTIKRVIIEMVEIMNIEAGYTQENAPEGFGFWDDDCNLLTPEMYEVFGYPVLRDIFNRFSPTQGSKRYQHSDSEMSHLLPLLAKVNLTGCNFGPTLTVEQIRSHMPKTRIDGQLAPFTFMRDNKEEIIAEVKRDCEMAKSTGVKGLNIATAGSINNGSSLAGMRAVMYAIQEYGQY